MNRPTRCHTWHLHPSPESAIECDTARWLARMIETGVDPDEAKAAAHRFRTARRHELARSREIARARAQGLPGRSTAPPGPSLFDPPGEQRPDPPRPYPAITALQGWEHVP